MNGYFQNVFLRHGSGKWAKRIYIGWFKTQLIPLDEEVSEELEVIYQKQNLKADNPQLKG